MKVVYQWCWNLNWVCLQQIWIFSLGHQLSYQGTPLFQLICEITAQNHVYFVFWTCAQRSFLFHSLSPAVQNVKMNQSYFSTITLICETSYSWDTSKFNLLFVYWIKNDRFGKIINEYNCLRSSKTENTGTM